MARQDLEPDERDREPLTFTSFVECLICMTEFEAVFEGPEGTYEAQDLSEAPLASVTCPACKTPFMARYEGWVQHDDV